MSCRKEERKKGAHSRSIRRRGGTIHRIILNAHVVFTTTKRAKTGGRGNAHDTNENEKLLPHARINVIAQLVDMDGNNAGPQLDLPHDCTSKQLEELLNTLLNNTEEKGEKLPYEFYIKDETLTTDLGTTWRK